MPEIFSSDHLVQGPAERIELPDGYVRGLRVAVHQGEGTFGDNLKDMVALSYGTSEGGELDLNQFEAAVKAGEYLKERAGQPFVIVDLMYREEGLVRIDGVAGVLAEVPDAVGTKTSDRKGEVIAYGIDHFNAGIAVEGKASGIEWEKWGADAPLRLRSCVVIAEGVLPFNFPTMFTELGTLRTGQREHDDIRTEQHIIAGDDILPWIAETFKEGDRYDVFLGLLNALRDTGTGAERYLAEPEYLKHLARDRRTLMLAQSALEKADKAMREEKDGAIIRATFNLRALVIKTQAGSLALRHGLKMLDELPGVRSGDIDNRLRRVDIDLTHDYHPGSLTLK
jgi:hypothetical protein